MKSKINIRKIRNIVGLLFLGSIIVACQESNPSEGQNSGEPMEVVVQTIERKNITVEAELPGRTTASVIAEVRPQVGGIILNQNFTEGTTVEKGDTLYQIDPAIFEANLMQAEAVLERAKANQYAAKMKAERINALQDSKAISKQDIDDANSGLYQANAEIFGAQAQVKNAEINLNYTKMLAPITGQIGRSNFTQGALVSPGQVLEMAIIQQIDPMRVDIAYSSAEYSDMLRKIKDGIYTSITRVNEKGEEEDSHAVRIYLEDGSLYPEVGFIRFSDPTVSETTGSILLQAEFPNTNGILLPGMFVKTVVEQGIEIGAVTVPQRILTQDLSGKSKVIIARKATQEEISMMKEKAKMDIEYVAEEREVVISRSYGTDWVLSSGLEENEQVVVEGFNKIQMGLQRTPFPFIPIKPTTFEEYSKGMTSE